jgi:hypothetical protein
MWVFWCEGTQGGEIFFLGGGGQKQIGECGDLTGVLCDIDLFPKVLYPIFLPLQPQVDSDWYSFFNYLLIEVIVVVVSGGIVDTCCVFL